MKPSDATYGISTTGLGQRFDPPPFPYFYAKVTAVRTVSGYNRYSLLEVTADLLSGGHVDKPGGLVVTERAYEQNNGEVSVGTVVVARFRAWGSEGQTYEFTAGSGGPAGDKGLLVDFVHVVSHQFTPFDSYTCKSVRHGTSSGGVWEEYSGGTTYTGVLENQGRLPVIDTSPTVSRGLPLYLDVAGKFWFNIDQFADGDPNPDASPSSPVIPPLDGLVSADHQVMGDGVKGFRRGVAVNLARDADMASGTDLVPAVRVYNDAGEASAFALTVYSHGSPFPYPNLFPGFGAGGTVTGAKTIENLTGLYPLGVDGAVYCNGVAFGNAGFGAVPAGFYASVSGGIGAYQGIISTGPGGAVYGGNVTLTYSKATSTAPTGETSCQATLYFGAASSDAAGNPTSVRTGFLITGPAQSRPAYEIFDFGRYIGLSSNATYQAPGGAFGTLWFQGGILYRHDKPDGTTEVGGQSTPVGQLSLTESIGGPVPPGADAGGPAVSGVPGSGSGKTGPTEQGDDG